MGGYKGISLVPEAHWDLWDFLEFWGSQDSLRLLIDENYSFILKF